MTLNDAVLKQLDDRIAATQETIEELEQDLALAIGELNGLVAAHDLLVQAQQAAAGEILILTIG